LAASLIRAAESVTPSGVACSDMLDLIQNLLCLLTNLSISGLNARILAPIIAYGLQIPCRKLLVLPFELLDKLAQLNGAHVQFFLKHIQGVQSRTANGLKQLWQPACLSHRREQIYKQVWILG